MKEFIVHLAWRALGAFLGLLVGGALGVFLGDVIAEMLNISNFEGGRGYFVLLLVLPLFLLGGAILGAIMIYLTWRWNLGISTTLLVVLGIFLFTQRYQFIPTPPVVEKVGNFDLLTYTSKNWGDYYGLRYRGEPFPIEGRAGMFGDEKVTYESFNAIITFTLPITMTEPAFVVNVGDPNNTSFFYLVREVDGQAKVEYLSDTSGGNVAADWLDVAPADPTAPRELTLHRGQLEGGRWLLLGDNCVLDVHTLRAYPFATYPLQDGSDASINSFKLPLALAPDHQSLVRLGTNDVSDWGTDQFRGYVVRLIVYNFVTGASYTLPIDRAQMRYANTELIDHAWLNHYFTWQATSGAPDRLAPRADVTPLPYQGYLTSGGQDQQYNLVPVKAELLDKVVGFLEQKFNAVQLKTQRYDTSTYVDLQIDARKVTVSYSNDSYADPHLALWQETQASQEGGLVAEIAQRFDDVLKTGVYDTLFLGDPVAVTEPVIEGIATFTNLSQEHVTEPVQYEQTPPVGGKHHAQWLTCGVYTAPVPNEQAVHSLEHGAVWITYQPELPAEQIEQLKALTKAGVYRLLSPYSDLPSPIVVSAWGLQLKLEKADDPRLMQFVVTYENRIDGPEYGAPCSGGVGTPEP